MQAVQVPVAEVYQRFETLPEECRPAWVVREAGATLVTIDPRTRRREAVEWAVSNLSRSELTAMRAAHGVPPVDQPCPDHWLDDSPVDLFVPPGLRLRPLIVLDDVSPTRQRLAG